VHLDDAAIAGADCVLVLTDHSGVPYERIARSAPLVIDTRNALRNYPSANVIRL
jgi:UDP-N-acetyl-D-glucosamine dehydrogenase